MRIGVTWEQHSTHRAVVELDDELVDDLAEDRAPYRAIAREWKQAQDRGEAPTLPPPDEQGHLHLTDEVWQPYHQAQTKFWDERKGKIRPLMEDVRLAREQVIEQLALEAAQQGDGVVATFVEEVMPVDTTDLDHACAECQGRVESGMYLYPPGLDDPNPDAASWHAHDHEGH
jgi:hypothetical protein